MTPLPVTYHALSAYTTQIDDLDVKDTETCLMRKWGIVQAQRQVWRPEYVLQTSLIIYKLIQLAIRGMCIQVALH